MYQIGRSKRLKVGSKGEDWSIETDETGRSQEMIVEGREDKN